VLVSQEGPCTIEFTKRNVEAISITPKLRGVFKGTIVISMSTWYHLLPDLLQHLYFIDAYYSQHKNNNAEIPISK
jgi:hypothetical protein